MATATKPRPAKAKPAKPADLRVDYDLRGDCGVAFGCTDREFVLSGPADTGKTFAMCLKAHTTCASIPNVQGAIIRKVYGSLVGTVVKTFQRVVAGRGVEAYGSATPSRFMYPNGSVIWMGGMDNPGKALSSERDFVMVNQAEELSLNDWEILSTRCSGRGAVVKNPWLGGDCNPGGSRHWIRQRAKEGRLRLLCATHADNPNIYTSDGLLTPDGRKRLAVLDEGLTGVRRMRLFQGLWVTAEGAVYDIFDSTIGTGHVREREPREMKSWYLAIDGGWTHPAVILLVGEDGDGRWHVFQEFYKSHVLNADLSIIVKQWGTDPIGTAAGVPTVGAGPRVSLTVVDESEAELIAALNNMGVHSVPGKGLRKDGIHAIQDRLKVQGDGKPRLTVSARCVNIINEFESYVMNPKTDEPVKENDHCMDAIRYLSDVLTKPTGAFGSGSDVGTAADPPWRDRERIEVERIEW